MKILNGLPLLAAGMFVVACGGEGGSPTPTPTPTNNAPSLAGGDASLSVVENSTGILFTRVASDPDGDSLTYSLSGPDAASFTVSAGGQVSFTEAPNYDRPIDSGLDNIYNFAISATDGRLSASVAAEVTVTNDKEGVSVRRIATGFNSPVGMDFGPVDNTLVVAEADGTIWNVSGRDGSRSLQQEVSLAAGSELIDVAYGNLSTGTIMPGAVVMVRSASGIFLWRNGAGSFIDATLATGAPEGAWGAVAFGNDGWLYAVVGDPGGTRAQGDTGYGRSFVPTDPYAGASLRAIPIQMAGRGVQQPGGLSAYGQRLLFADQASEGEHEISSMSLQGLGTPVSMPNFGWPFFSGTVLQNSGAPSSLVNPLLVYAVGNGPFEGSGIVLGGIYFGATASINEKYVFGDRNGTIWATPLDTVQNSSIDSAAKLENRTEDFVPDQGMIDEIVEIKADLNGRFFILDADGDLFVVP